MHDVVVVGAGVIGASVAWHLARLGVHALVLERGAAPGQGSTGRATGGFRAQFGTDINVRLSLLALEALRRFEEDTGVDPGYAPRGYLWLARTAAQVAALQAAQAVQHAAGLREARMLDAAGIRELRPSFSARASPGSRRRFRSATLIWLSRTWAHSSTTGRAARALASR